MSRRLNMNISRILTYGTMLSLLFIILSVVELVITGTHITTYQELNILKLLQGLVSFNPTDTLYIALLVIIFTPITNLVYIFLYFVFSKKFASATFPLTTLIILIVALILGFAV